MVLLKTPQDIIHLKKAGHTLASVLSMVLSEVKPGVTTKHLDELAEKKIREAGCIPAFKNYKNEASDPPYPSTLCTSVNNEVVHAPASERILKEGDIIGIDIGLEYRADEKSYFVDMAKTVGVGTISEQAQKLLEVTKHALDLAIQQVKPGNLVSDIAKAVQPYVEQNGFSVVRQLVGHGVGFSLHEEPQVPNYVDGEKYDIPLTPGMVIAIEPMVNMGAAAVKTLSDGWTIVTDDDSLSAHFEHTVAITESGHEILTQ